MRSLRLALLLGLPACAHGFGFSVEPGKKLCFEEAAKSSERISGEWRVLSGGVLDLDVTVTGASPSLGVLRGLSQHQHAPSTVHRRIDRAACRSTSTHSTSTHNSLRIAGSAVRPAAAPFTVHKLLCGR